MDKLLLRPLEAADVLAVSKSKIYELLSSGVIPSVRIGKSIRIPAEELQKWVRSRTRAIPNGLPLDCNSTGQAS